MPDPYSHEETHLQAAPHPQDGKFPFWGVSLVVRKVNSMEHVSLEEMQDILRSIQALLKTRRVEIVAASARPTQAPTKSAVARPPLWTPR